MDAGLAFFQFRIETSLDGENFSLAADRSGNELTRFTEFVEFPAAKSRFVRLTMLNWPRLSGAPLGIIEFTAFGKGIPLADKPATLDRKAAEKGTAETAR